jgi:adenylate kinase
MLIIFIGPPGSGKGTQSTLLLKNFSIPSICVGDILRAKIQNDIDLKQKMDSGSLLSSDYINQIMADELKKLNLDQNMILDGYPRTIEQALFLDEIYPNVKKVAVFFKSNDQDLIDRLSNRFLCSDCKAVYNKKYNNTKVSGVCDNCGGTKFTQRADDNKDVIKNRLEQYRNSTEPLLEYYSKSNILNTIDCSRDFQDVFSDVCGVINLI